MPAPVRTLRPSDPAFSDYVEYDPTFEILANAMNAGVWLAEALGKELPMVAIINGGVVGLQPDARSGVTQGIDSAFDIPPGAPGSGDVLDTVFPSQRAPMDESQLPEAWQGSPETAPPSPKPSAMEVLNKSHLTPPVPPPPAVAQPPYKPGAAPAVELSPPN
jgi:hypothetical protein